MNNALKILVEYLLLKNIKVTNLVHEFLDFMYFKQLEG